MYIRRSQHFSRRSCVAVLLLAAMCSSAVAQVAVLTQHNDNSRSGQNTGETDLKTSNVSVSQFGKLFALPVDGYLYAQPLYVPNLSIRGSNHNVVFAATEHNSVYAFDADDPAGLTLWHVNLGPSVPSDDICGGTAGCYDDLRPEIGITSTPVINPAQAVIYVVAKNKDSDGSYHYRLHALDLHSGAEMFAGPVEIAAPGFDPFYQLNRPGLLLAGGTLYLAFGSEGDTPPYHGWIMAYDPATLRQLAVLNTSPDHTGGSLWAGGQGLVADPAGFIYAITANGHFTANTGGSDYGDSFLKLNHSTLGVVDYFTPDNESYLAGPQDVDLGAGGPLLIPGTSLLLGGGKDGILRLVDSGNMGHFNSTFNADVQEWQATTSMIMGAPVYWNSPVIGPTVYLFGQGDTLKAWHFNGSAFDSKPAAQSTVTNPSGASNMGALSVSSNGSIPGTGILWASTPLSGTANRNTVPGILRAFDASDLTHELWNSEQNSSRDGVGNYAKFNPPTIAGGKVFLATFSKQLVIYGLLAAPPPGPSPDFQLSAAPASLTLSTGQSVTSSITITPVNGFAGAVSLDCSGLPSNAACSFNPPSLTLNGRSAVSVLTISRNAVVALRFWPHHRPRFACLAFSLPLPAFLFLAFSSDRHDDKRKLSMLLLCILVAVVILQLGCGGGGATSLEPSALNPPVSPASATYSVIVRGTSGSLVHSTVVTILVQ